MKRFLIIHIIVFGFASNGFAESIVVKDNHVVQGVIDNARVVNGGTLTLQGIASCQSFSFCTSFHFLISKTI